MRIMAVISCAHVSKSYHSDFFHRKRKKAVEGLSLDVAQGDVFGIVGPNGAGKSTLLKILMGFVRPDHGHVLLSGLPAGAAKAHRRLGYLPENPSLYPRLSVKDHLRFSCRIEGLNRSEASERIKSVLSAVDLEYAANLPIKGYSKGMTQRAALAYALLHNPEILILDEPMSGLDPLGRRLVVDIVRQYSDKRTTILFCSHILADVERICNRIGIMNKGRLVKETTPEELTPSSPSSTGKEQTATPLETFFLETIR